MNSTAVFTPLECLLLFQCLVAYGAEDDKFDLISERLIDNSLVKNGPEYNVAKLSPDSLRQSYLRLVAEELAAESEDGQDNDNSASSKKRKIPAPSIPSIKDALQYREKLPLVVDRLYARYREYMIDAIREDERRYAAVKREIQAIERGEQGEMLLEDAAEDAPTPAVETPSRANGRPPETVPQENKVLPEVPKESPPQHTQASPRTEGRPEGLAISDVLNSSQEVSRASPKLSEPPQGAHPILAPPSHHRNGSSGSHGPSPLQPGALGYQWERPYAPPAGHHPQHHYPSGPQPPPYSHPQYAPQSYQSPRAGSFSSSHGLPPPPPHHHVPSSPVHPQHPNAVHLPPLNSSIRRSSSSPGMPLDALADLAGHQTRAPSGSPMMQQPPLLPPAGYAQGYQQSYNQQHPPQLSPHHLPQHVPQQQQQQQQQHSPHQAQPQHPHQHPNHPHFHGRSPSVNGTPFTQSGPYMQQQYPPQQYPFVPSQRPPFQAPPNLMSQENRHYNSPYNASQGPKPLSAAYTPRSRPSAPHTPMARGPIPHTTGSGTRWTPIPQPGTPREPRALPPPPVEAVSPIARPAILSGPSKTSSKKVSPKAKAKSAVPKAARSGQRTRAGSTASSAIAGSHRSQSVISHADELSMDTETARAVKEEVATPVGISESATELPRSIPQISPQPASRKRKRASSIATTSRPPSMAPTEVTWTRAFPKISVSALESIAAHKFASTFAHPVKERDAPGYKSLVLRPQDLKSIRTAITAGHRAAMAAAPEDADPQAASIKLPISEDLIPPRGIINYAQLEKELMRMFANAVMFNADPDRGFGPRWNKIGKEKGDAFGYEIDEDGVVKDSRTMAADVQKIISNLRSAERRSEELRERSLANSPAPNVIDDEDELAGDGEAMGTIKRRRKA